MAARSLDDLTWPLHTERLTIRRPTPADAADVFAYRCREDVARWLTAWVTDEAEFRDDFPKRSESMLVIERDGDLIGDVMVRITSPWAQTEVADEVAGRQAELGWVLHPDATGNGYAGEAVAAVIDVCFDDVDGLGMHRIEANCFADNEASWRLMERLGMRREVHTIDESWHRDRRWHDGLGYAILSREWRKD